LFDLFFNKLIPCISQISLIEFAWSRVLGSLKHLQLNTPCGHLYDLDKLGVVFLLLNKLLDLVWFSAKCDKLLLLLNGLFPRLCSLGPRLNCNPKLFKLGKTEFGFPLLCTELGFNAWPGWGSDMGCDCGWNPLCEWKGEFPFPWRLLFSFGGLKRLELVLLLFYLLWDRENGLELILECGVRFE